MTSAGANTFSIELNLNNLESQIATGLVSGVSSISTSGAGLSTSSGTGAITLTNTGVTSLIAGSNITLSGGTGAVTINSTASGGISAVNGGTAVSTSTASGVVTVNNTGVTSIVAGSGVTVSGATGAVTINAIASPVIPSSTVIDIYGLVNTTITASQLANCYIYSSQLIPSPFSPNSVYYVTLPSYSALVSQYGGFAVIPFVVGNQRTTTANIRFQGDASIQIVSNLATGSSNLQVYTPQIGTAGYTLSNGAIWRGYCVLDPTNSIALYSLNYINNPLLL